MLSVGGEPLAKATLGDMSAAVARARASALRGQDHPACPGGIPMKVHRLRSVLVTLWRAALQEPQPASQAEAGTRKKVRVFFLERL